MSRNRIFAVCLGFLLAVPLGAAAQAAFDRIVVFGTSLSDPGNAFALVGGTNTPPDYSVDPFLVPDRPYAKGGHHFSNGPTWIEQYARPRGLSASVNPAFRGNSAKASNYAVGGARARASADNVHLTVQVESFLRDVGGIAPPEALYVVEMGGNDIRDALSSVNPSLLSAAADAVADNIRRLHGAGATKFLVWNAPNLGLTPAVIGAGPDAVAAAAFLSQTFNFLLDTELTALPATIELHRFDVFQKLHAVVGAPESFGLANVDTACITPNVPPFACKKADEYLFWDGIHPTRAMHAIIAHEAAAVLGR
ncbi:MAG: SGNH/GDSL hydrolase family protein [Betaproteobacteria bacterium]|nr:SGNH/GDSL hydrolase family protein [Betaproteobacteria bacterium]MDH4322765.1 SGNH/GDSL hydrolase family protein [Betaproteobacteria bacterium]